MKSLLLGLLAALQAAFMGVEVVEPEEKIFTPDAYYQPAVTDEPDYRSIYQTINGNSGISAQACDDGKRTLEDMNAPGLVTHMNAIGDPAGAAGKFWTYTFRPLSDKDTGDAFKRYFLASNTYQQSVESLAKLDFSVELEHGVNVYALPARTAIIAPGHGYLEKRSIRHNGTYPETYRSVGNTLRGNEGVSFEYIVEPTKSDPNYYKFVYGGVLRVWNCILKPQPDLYADGTLRTQPLYTQTGATSGKVTFQAGDILAEVGNTATPLSVRSENPDKMFTLVTVYRSPDSKDWARIPIEEFYYPN